MAMTWNTLVAPKGTAGSIMNWVNYSKLDQETCVEEAQSLLCQSLRVREMRTSWIFGIEAKNSRVNLPARFLDPIGRLIDTTFGQRYRHKDESTVTERRAFQPLAGGSFGADPFTTVFASAEMLVEMAAHGLTQESDITITGATIVDGVTPNGTLPVYRVFDADHFSINTGTVPTAGGITGGGAAATWTANQLIAGSPICWAIWDECLQFDQAFDTATQFRLPYYRAPALLTAASPSNFLTDRYPMLMRKACMAAAADFMKDDTEYQKQVSALNNLIQSTAAGDDLIYRGAEFGTDTP